jgi:hypothetical protein
LQTLGILILGSFLNVVSLLSFVLIQKKQKIKAGKIYSPFQAALWYTGATVACTTDLYCTPLVQAVFIIGWQRVYLFEGTSQMTAEAMEATFKYCCTKLLVLIESKSSDTMPKLQ